MHKEMIKSNVTEKDSNKHKNLKSSQNLLYSYLQMKDTDTCTEYVIIHGNQIWQLRINHHSHRTGPVS